MKNQELREAAIEASKHAYSPYSKVQVGNIENSSFGGTVCAERVAMWKAVSTGTRNIKKLYVYTKDGWPPCGLCLQVLSEFSTPDTIVIIGDGDNNESVKTFKELFPLAFTPNHLVNS